MLGGLSAAVDGRPVELPADARARELLARLALSPGPHPRSALAGRLRPDVAEDSARKTLRNALYELRRALGPAGRDALLVTGERVGLPRTRSTSTCGSSAGTSPTDGSRPPRTRGAASCSTASTRTGRCARATSTPPSWPACSAR